MPAIVNIRHLEDGEQQLKGELPAEELDLDLRDEIVRVERPLRYALVVQQLNRALLVQGCLQLTLHCECVRCLKPFEYNLELSQWTRHVPLEGEESARVVNDCVDLTPYLREDILLEFPQHPLCEANCRGLPNSESGGTRKTRDALQAKAKATAWGELDKLKF